MRFPYTLMFVAGIAQSAAAQSVITVTTLSDVSDTTPSVEALPGPDGEVSLREAIAAVNATPGTHRIEFMISGDERRASQPSIELQGQEPLVLTRDETTIDFFLPTTPESQSGTMLAIDHRTAALRGQPGLIIRADGCEISGMGMMEDTNFSIAIEGGSDNRIIGSITNGITVNEFNGQPAERNTIGGTMPGEGNILSNEGRGAGGTVITFGCGANDNVVVGNLLQAVGISGSPFCAPDIEFPTNNRIGGPTPAERNVINNFGGTNGSGCAEGEGIDIQWAKQTTIEGNYIGLSSNGLNRLNSGSRGITLKESDDTIIRGNVISGLRRSGVAGCSQQLFGTAIFVTAFSRSTDGLIIEDNIIGLDANGENPVPTLEGIEIDPMPDPIINVLIRNNIISRVDRFGIRLDGFRVDGVEITQNSIFDNGGRGIEIFGGANGSPSIPALNDATATASGTSVSGELNSDPDEQFRIELFASVTCDASGSGEGEVFLGSFEIVTDASGNAAFSETVPGAAPEGWVVTATATNLTERTTSEFSVCVTATGSACPADINGDGMLDFFDISDFLSAFNSQQPPADFNGDGNFDFFDVSAYIQAFNAGCP